MRTSSLMYLQNVLTSPYRSTHAREIERKFLAIYYLRITILLLIKFFQKNQAYFKEEYHLGH